MIKNKPTLPFYVDFQKLSKALFVLSQKALKRKVRIYEIQQNINKAKEAEPPVEYKYLIGKISQLKKKQNEFYEKRTEVLRFLINKKAVKVYGYVQIKDDFYANLRIANYDFYVIINKKMVNRLELKFLGNELKYTKDLPLEEVEAIMDSKQAYGYLSNLSKEVKKALAHELEMENKAYLEQKNSVLAKTVSNTGSVVVIKRKNPNP
ncbi:hypothetical protein HLH17_14945 [Acinetobacter sp. ANC 5380]|uniref:Uncharacterized protein n=1 Tax=Acinetobacter terrae TaxID=2731247 RepID=A0A7Y2WCL3_9GAMM|nr:hypothetical protein [Acinetobacter terrae]NNH78918.1 hypothetical protein [Acinetobacter terrae]